MTYLVFGLILFVIAYVFYDVVIKDSFGFIRDPFVYPELDLAFQEIIRVRLNRT